MRCPRCNFEGESVGGGCAHCGYGRMKVSGDSSFAANQYTLASPNRLVSSPTGTLIAPALKRGDVLHQGRYRLMEQLVLPENQKRQGTAWLASDTQLPQSRVIVREVNFPVGGAVGDKEKLVRAIGARFAELAQHPGFPRVIDVFSEQEHYYLVLQHIEGESLATALNRQGGALPERVVAEYGRQLAEMLSILFRQQPPLVHGTINPETIIVSPGGKRVSLIHMPLFPPKEATNGKAASGYLAPEQTRGLVEPSSDLYALAATLHHAVTGYDPHERMAFFHPPARRLNPAVSARLESILAQELRLSPSQRYVRPSDMQKDLSALIASYPPESALPAQVASAEPLGLNAAELRQKSHRRSVREASIFAGVSLVVLFGFLLILLRPNFNIGSAIGSSATATSLAQQQALNAEIALETQTFQGKGIGLSDGRFVFDTFPARTDVTYKKNAALAIQQGDLSSAVNWLTKAVTSDPIDGEAQIYNEDLHILQSGDAYVTIVMGLAIDNSSIHLDRGRADLEAAYLAQHEVNIGNRLPNGLKLRLLIDNCGTDNANVAEVAQFIANRVAKAGNLDHIIGVVGWPFSSQTINARDIIAGVHLPLMSQTASSVKLTGSSPYFFRVNPPDDQQGATLGKVAVQLLQAKKFLVMRDPTDPYSTSLADAFVASAQALKGIVISNPSDYFTEGTTTVAQYQVAVHDAITNKVDLIFLPGFDADAVRLANALGNASRAAPTDTYLAHLRILGGDGVATGLILGQGNGPDATIANTFPQDMRRLIFTAFGHPNEWKLFPQMHQPQFFFDWASTYQSSPIKTDNGPPPGNDAILTYDAVQVLIRAANSAQVNLTGQAIRNTLAALGTGKIPAYQGVSGRIQFDGRGNPVNKAVVVLDVVNTGNGNQIQLLQVAGAYL